LDILAEVQERYVAVQANDELLSVLGERVTIIDRLLQVARSRLNLGEGTRLDVLSLEAQRVELQTELAERGLERRDERLRLARLIGEPSSAADWSLTPWGDQPQVMLSESDWVEVALQKRPEVQQQIFKLAGLGEEARLSGFAWAEGAEAGIEGERDDGDWAIGPSVSVPLPIFDTGQARRARSQAALVEARHDLTNIRRGIIEEVRRAHAAVAASRENFGLVRNELVPAAQRRLDQAESQFRAGQTDITALLQAEQDLRGARSRQVEFERRSSESYIRLQRAVGGPAVMGAMSAATQPSTQPSVP
jgi:cobalt-zinc-cadmium efflux system outer membrane protein